MLSTLLYKSNLDLLLDKLEDLLDYTPTRSLRSDSLRHPRSL